MKKNNVKDLVDFFVYELGFSANDAFEKITTELKGITGEITIRQKFNDLCEMFGERDALEIAQKLPRILSVSSDKVQEKIDFYFKHYGMMKSDIVKKLKAQRMSILSVADTSILSREKFHKTRYDISHSEFSKLIKRSDSLIVTSKETVIDVENYVRKEFGVNRDKFAQMIKNDSNIVKNVESLKNKQEWYDEHFGISKEEFGKSIQNGYALIGSNPESIEENYQKIASATDMTREQFAKMIISSPQMAIGPERVIRGYENLVGLGIDSYLILENPKCLARTPATITKNYVMSKFVGMQDAEFLKGGYQQRASKTYARYMGMLENEDYVKSYMFIGTNAFKKWTGLDDDEIMRRYPLSTEVFDRILREMNERRVFKIKLEVEEK